MHLDPLQMDASSRVQWKRSLGPLEQWFYAMDKNRANHFSLAVEVTGEISAEECADGLLKLQARHPLLNASIENSSGMTPSFKSAPGAHIQLRLSTREGPDTWKQELQFESVKAIDTARAPLLRAVLLTADGHSDLIFTVHHSVTDGMGLVLLMRDFFNILSSQQLSALPVPQAVESVRDHLGLPSPVAVPNAKGTAAVALSTTYRSPMDAVRVSAIRVDVEQTARIIRATRLHGVTVHAALTAALVIAGRHLSDRWKNAPVRVFSPISLRETLKLHEELTLALGAGAVRFEPGEESSFWQIAHYGLEHLAPYRTLESNFFLGEILGGVAVASEAVAEFTAEHFGYELMVSNLGRIQLDAQASRLKVTNAWGPSVTFGFAHEQVVGALTINGSLNLTHTSAAPILGLLPKAVELLLAASP